MAKRISDQQLTKRGIYFIIAAGVIWLAFLVSLAVVIFGNMSFSSYSKIARKGNTIKGTDLFQLNEGDYYVYIFASDEDNNKINRVKQNHLENFIVNYFDFVKQNKRKYSDEIIPIILMDVSDSVNDGCLGSTTVKDATSWTNFKVNEAEVPLLLYFYNTKNSDGSISHYYTTFVSEIEIAQKLQSSISLIPVAYIPSKKEDNIEEAL